MIKPTANGYSRTDVASCSMLCGVAKTRGQNVVLETTDAITPTRRDAILIASFAVKHRCIFGGMSNVSCFRHKK